MFPYKYELDDPYFTPGTHDEIGSKSYHAIANAVRSLAFDNYWLSKKMRDEVIEFYTLVSSYHDPYGGYANEEVENMVSGMPKVKEHLTRLLSTYTLDMEGLHDVVNFFKEKRSTPVEVWPKYFSDLIK